MGSRISPRSGCTEGQTSVKVWKPSAQTRHHSAAWDGMASLMQTSRAEGPPETESRGPVQARTTHSFKGLMLNELLAMKESKGFGKKCNFSVGRKFSPNATPSPPLLLILSVPQREKGDKRRTSAKPRN